MPDAQIRLVAELVYTPDPAKHPDAGSVREVAERDMDHAPDLLYDSPDTVYRFEVVGEEAPAPATPSPSALIEEIEGLLARLKTAVGA